MTWTRKIGLGIVLAALLGASHSEGAKPRRRRPTPTPTPAFTPTPTPIPLLRAAGSCLRYEKDHFLVLAEVGTAGRVFHVDKSTIIAAKIATGARLRILYEDTPEGPLAKRILPGPLEAAPTPAR
jgi:hypothetical protein